MLAVLLFLFLLENIDCGYSIKPPLRGGSNEYPRSMVSSKNKNNNIYPFKPLFYYIKVGFKGVKIIKVCFRDDSTVWMHTYSQTQTHSMNCSCSSSGSTLFT